MKIILRLGLLSVVVMALLFLSCNDKDGKGVTVQEETMTAGNLVINVDTTIQPIVEDVLAVFHSVYGNAHIIQVNRNETDIINAMLHDSVSVAVLSRELTKDEEAHFSQKNILPRTVPFAIDAVALIGNRASADTLIQVQELYKVMQGKESSIKKLVFDNANSSTVHYLMKKAGVDKIPLNNIYSVKSTAEVLKFVNENSDAIGVVGVNWLTQPPTDIEHLISSIRVLSIGDKDDKQVGNGYYKPSQSNIAEGLYPLSRKLYLLNYQGRNALGMGFATYLSAPEGQRIVLKSGLVPVTIPPREIEVRNKM